MSDHLISELRSAIGTAIRHVTGTRAEVAEIEDWGCGALNACFKVTTTTGDRFFLKMENEGIIPTTRRGQAAREVEGLRLMRAAGINVPATLHAETTGQELKRPYVILEFIDADLLWVIKDTLTPEDNARLRDEITVVMTRMNAITNPLFGDLYVGGVIGQHATWGQASMAMADLLLDDCGGLGLFTPEEERLVREALTVAASQCSVGTAASLCHGDLGKHNVLADRMDGLVHVGTIIDLGNAMWLPSYMNEDGMRRFGGWDLEPVDVCARDGLSQREYAADSLVLSLEGVAFWGMLSRHWNKDPREHIDRFLNECRALL